MEIVYKSIEELQPYENNPRQNDKAVEYVAKSIQEFGFKVPIVIDKNNVIVAGHTRYKASQQLGIKEVPCIVADDLSDEQVKAFRLADNKVSEAAQWDENLLNMELDDIINIDMDDFGFDLGVFDSDDYGTTFELQDGEKSNMEQITFTLTSEQASLIREALTMVKDEITETFGNENKNGNAIYEVVRQWVQQRT